MAKYGSVASQREMEEMLSRKGAGKFVPDGTKIVYTDPPKTKPTPLPKNKKRKPEIITKRTTGYPTPAMGTDEGNIFSQRKTAGEYPGTDIEFLREMRREQAKDIQFKKGGKVRGAGIAQKGIKKCKMVKAK